MLVRKIGFLLFDGFTAMDVIGPLEAFATVQEVSDYRYEIVMLGVQAGPVRAESGIAMHADVPISSVYELDTLVVPGGVGAREPALQQYAVPWMQRVAPKCRRVVSICTGSFLLASTGLLDGQKATTHWAFVEKFKDMFPDIRMQPDALYVDNGKFATSAGIASGIDLTLKLIEDDLGSDIASKVARFLVVHFRRAGDQAQYSEPLQFQVKADSKFASLTAWILDNLASELSLETLADQAGMSVRNFCRKFRQQTGETPGKYVETLRLDYARQLLAEKDWAMIKVAQACGYQNADVFRRAFKKRFQLSPKLYRASFNTTSEID